jgi:hypothetical protein
VAIIRSDVSITGKNIILVYDYKSHGLVGIFAEGRILWHYKNERAFNLYFDGVDEFIFYVLFVGYLSPYKI